jgi:hypothetical protein
MHLTILRKILARVKTDDKSVTLLNLLDPKGEKFDPSLEALADALEAMEKEAKHLDLITPPGHE